MARPKKAKEEGGERAKIAEHVHTLAQVQSYTLVASDVMLATQASSVTFVYDWVGL